MALACDHDASRASFEAFISGTRLIGGQSDGDGGWLLLGTCTACNSTLAIPIAEPRGNALHGEIATDDPPPVRESRPCELNRWCGDFAGHEGDCIPPF